MAKRRTAAAKARTARKTRAKKRQPRGPRRSPNRRPSQPGSNPTLAPSPAPLPQAAAAGAVRVRMYRQGLGDCFLVTLPKQDGSSYFLMIDCGVILGTQDAAAKMNNVVADIISETNGHVDLLVVTHEHWDHVSGFNQASALFAPANSDPANNRLTIGQLWFAWTEDPNDALATRLRKDRAQRLQKLAAFVSANAAQSAAAPEANAMVDGINEVLSFFGVDAKTGQVGNSTEAALAFARGLSNKVRYCLPSDPPVPLPGVPGIRVYVLGPPHDEKALRKTDSTTEVYRELADFAPASAFFAAAGSGTGLGAGLTDDSDRYNPFDKSYQLDLQTLSQPTSSTDTDVLRNFFEQYYFSRYPDSLAPDQSWRRIDATWLGAAAEFALQLDSFTNNTSLVLAIEFIDSGRVLLFAADAQVGNWLSWQNLSWKISENQTVTGPDLLKRTVFYRIA
jgi:hypothetical protein